MDKSLVILIIDDNEDDRLLCKRSLLRRLSGPSQFLEAASGESGLEAINNNVLDCVLLDYSLPGRSGIEVLKKIRASSPFLPVIMLTGQGNEGIAVESMREGAQDYIVKSNLTPEALERVIRNSVARCVLEKRVHEQQEALTLFTHALAHDLKEPMRTIRAFVGLMAKDRDAPEKMDAHFRFVSDAADRMAMLIDTVFLYTTLDAKPGIAAPCDMQHVVAEVRDNLGLLFKERRAVLASGDLPVTNAHHGQMIQLVQNLCVNAVRHSPDPVTIHLTAVERGQQWLFSVSDNGPGIDATYLEAVFAPFKRLTSNEDGAGLGLAICRKIVDLAGGRMWCESTPGKGSTFFFLLPQFVEPAMLVLPQTAPHVFPLRAENVALQVATILVVDDRKADIELSRMMLMEIAKLKCKFLIAFDGREALGLLEAAAAKHNHIDLMLLDINMPVMDGFELLERIQVSEQLKRTSVVMCSGSTYDKDIARAKSLGAIGYLEKPPMAEQLFPIIETSTGMRLERNGDGYTLFRAA